MGLQSQLFRGDQKLDMRNRALFNAIETERAVPLFNKLAVGRWQFLGFWRVREGKYIFDEKQNRMVWRFKLQRDVGDQKSDRRRQSRNLENY